MITPIQGFGLTGPVTPPLPSPAPAPTAPADPGSSFSSFLGGIVNDANTAQVNADEAIKSVLKGEGDIHEVVLQMEQARLSMMMMVEMRNRVVEAYQQLSQMPV